MTDIADWLKIHGLEKLTDVFVENEIDLQTLDDLSEEDVRELIPAIGPRRRFLKARAEGGAPAGSQTSHQTSHQSGAAERRQVTVLFSDLVGSTALSAALDPEDMTQVFRDYREIVESEITRMDGFVSQHQGDGVVAFFGYPNAHEEDAERAASVGLAIVRRVAGLTAPNGQPLSARVGIATGVVVVGGDEPGGEAANRSAVGETPNLAARLQSVAGEGQVVVSPETLSLLGAAFDTESLGSFDLKGIPHPVEAHRVLSARTLETRFEARGRRGVNLIVGRSRELATISACWRAALGGEGGLALVTGEAGIGKSRIVQAVIDEVKGAEHLRLTLQCSPYHVDSALYPLSSMLDRQIRRHDGADDATLAGRLAEICKDAQTTALLGALLGLRTDALAPLDMTPAQQRARTLAASVETFARIAKETPLLLVLEDLHWADPTMLDLLTAAIAGLAGSRVLMLATARPEFQHDFGGAPATRLNLSRLDRAQVGELARSVAGATEAPDAVLDLILERTDGVPLFVEELTKTIVESDQVRKVGARLELVGRLDRQAIPSTLQDSLMARLDRDRLVKETAQIAACIGRDFDHATLTAVADHSEADLAAGLDGLVSAELAFRRGEGATARYRFKHALVRDIAYESLLRTRRRAAHGALFAHLKTTRAAPEILAHHATGADMKLEAIENWTLAGEQAMARPAFVEAINHLSAAIDTIRQMGDAAEWRERELGVNILLGHALNSVHGWSSPLCTENHQRAMALTRSLGDTPHRYPAYYNWFLSLYTHSNYAGCLELAEECVALAEAQDDGAPKLFAHRMMGTTLLIMGRDLDRAIAHFETALSHYPPPDAKDMARRFGQDFGLAANIYLSMALWITGRQTDADAHMRKARQISDDLALIPNISYFNTHEQIFCYAWGQTDRVLASAQAGMELLNKYDLGHFKPFHMCYEGFSRVATGDPSGVDLWERSFAMMRALNLKLYFAPMLTCAAESFVRLGRLEEARARIAEAIAVSDETEDRWARPEMERIAALIEAADGADPAVVEAGYRKAIATAEAMSAPGWALRSANALAEHLRAQDRADEAEALLRATLSRVSQPLDGPDIETARALLNESQSITAE